MINPYIEEIVEDEMRKLREDKERTKDWTERKFDEVRKLITLIVSTT